MWNLNVSTCTDYISNMRHGYVRVVWKNMTSLLAVDVRNLIDFPHWAARVFSPSHAMCLKRPWKKTLYRHHVGRGVALTNVMLCERSV